MRRRERAARGRTYATADKEGRNARESKRTRALLERAAAGLRGQIDAEPDQVKGERGRAASRIGQQRRGSAVRADHANNSPRSTRVGPTSRRSRMSMRAWDRCSTKRRVATATTPARRRRRHDRRDALRPHRQRRVRSARKRRRLADSDHRHRPGRRMHLQRRERAGRRQRSRRPPDHAAVRARPGRRRARRHVRIAGFVTEIEDAEDRGPDQQGHRRAHRANRSSASSAGRRKCRACSSSPATRTSTRWASPIRCSRTRTARAATAHCWPATRRPTPRTTAPASRTSPTS